MPPLPARPSHHAPPSARLVALAVLAACRIPYLTSPNYVLDGDEAILGLMARHAAAGSEPSVFFYGQTYGFSLVEVLAAATGMKVAGGADLALPLSMLALFLLGLGLWERAFRTLAGDGRWSLMLATFLGLLPVWIVWSLKARGGYLTAFVLAGAVVWLVARPRLEMWGAVAAGVLTGALAQAQPLWLPGLIPLLLLPAVRPRTPGEAPSSRVLGALGMAAALAAAGIGVAGGQLGTSWAPALLLDFNPANLLALPHHIFWLFTGFFLLGEAWAAPIPVAAVALVATATLFGVFVYFGRDLQKAGDRTDLLVALSPLLALAPAVVLEEVLPRYLLSVTVFMFVAIAHGVGRHRPSLGGREVTALGVLLLVLVVAATQTSRLRTHAVGTGSDVEEELRALVETLRVNGVEAVYATDGLLQWQIAFYGHEFAPIRSRRAVDRVPAYVAGVDSVARSGGRTAMVAPVDQVIRDATGALPPGLHAVGTDYVVLPDPNPTLLTLLGFEIPR